MSSRPQRRRNRWGFKLARWFKKQTVKKENNQNFDRWLKKRDSE